MWIVGLVGCGGGTVFIEDGTVPISESATPEPTTALTVRPRNLLMISIDTLRRDHIDRYATDGVERMPFLSGLLAESVVLDDHQECSNWTFASTFCTLTGQHLTEGTVFPRMTGEGQEIPDGQRTLARILGDAGFQTALASTNIYLSEETGSGQGYDLYTLDRGQEATVAFAQGQLHLQTLTAGESPWFLHVHLFDPHEPYLPPLQYVDPPGEPWDLPYDLSTNVGQSLAINAWESLTPDERAHLEAWLRGAYTGEARYVDARLAETWAALDAAGHLDDTLVVFWTDHGEAFWEHDTFGHAKLLTSEENDAMLAFWARDQPPVAWSGPTQAVDMVPTVLDALGVPLPDGLSGQVVGLADPDRPRFSATSAYLGQHNAVTVGDYKLHYGWGGTYRMWNRRDDPAELTDVYADEPEVAEALWELLLPQIQQADALIPEWSPVF